MSDLRQSDDMLATEVQRVLALDPTVNVHDLRVEAQDGTVRLYGISPSAQEVRRALELIAQVRGVQAVDNLIAVDTPLGVTDAHLQEQAQSAAGAVDGRISVQVSNGLAILRGSVDDPAVLDRVTAAVERIPGIGGVRSDVVLTRLMANTAPFDRE